ILEQGCAGATVLPFEERSCASAVPERGVQVAGRPCGTDVVLGHEGERAALHVGDLFRAMLVEGVTVSHLQRFSITQVDLLLPLAPLPLGELHRYISPFHTVADGADEWLLPSRLEDVIIFQIPGNRRQSMVTLSSCFFEGLFE